MKEKELSSRIKFNVNGFDQSRFSSQVDLKTDHIKKNRKLMAGRVSSDFITGIGNNFSGRFGHWIERDKRVILGYQLSETKIYPHYYVHNSSISLFE